MSSTLRARIIPAFLALATLFYLFFSFVNGAYASSNDSTRYRQSGYTPAPSNTAVLTFKNDNNRTGQDPNETILNTSNVQPGEFGKRISYPVDGQVYAQPLFLPNVTINAVAHNVVIVATEHDSVYAFDADQTGSAPPLWQARFLSSTATTVLPTDVQCGDLTPEIGITSTPVIDSSTNTLYVVAFTKESGQLVYRLHALDATTGLDKLGSPVRIQASVPGSGAGSVNGVVKFDPVHERQRAALTLANGQIYMAFASFCDNDPYHGWILGYTYSGSAFTQASVYNESHNGTRGGIWGAGGAVAADSSGNIFFMSGNGNFTLNTGGTSAGDTFGRLNAHLSLQDYFTPFNQSCLEAADADLGSGGPLLVTSGTMNEVIGAGKEGRIYVVNRSAMGKYTAIANPCANQSPTNIDKIVQELPPHTTGGIFSNPAYWNGPGGQFVYFTGQHDHTKAFKLTNGRLSSTFTSQTPESFGLTGNAEVSSNSTASGTGIVWIIDPGAVLRAYDATNLSHELYNSKTISGDALDSFVKFSAPTIANGEVFVGTKTALDIFGKTTSTLNSFNNIGISDDTNPTAANYDGSIDSYSAQALKSVGIVPGGTVSSNGVNFTWPNVPSGTLDNWQAIGQTVTVTPVSGADTLAFLGSATDGAASGNATITYTDNTTLNFPLGMSDWTLGGGAVPPSFGNGKAATMSYRNTPTGKQTVTTYVFYTSVALQAGKTIKSVTLPSLVTGGQLHVFAVGTKNSTVPSFNNVGVTDDSNTKPGNYDTGGRSYSAQALQAADNIMPGGTVTFNGVTFTWPSAPSGTQDNYLASGQVIPVTPVSNATTLAFLGSAIDGVTSGTATITYTDSTTQTFTLGLSDWTLGGGTASPSFGNGKVATMSYRNTPTGKETVMTYVFYTDVVLQAGKTIKSVTLPSSVTGGQIHVFSVSTK
ncbi:MAG TPA: hypothetical protein VF043_23770 [Ktedonobacteraceae bacterium]